MARSRITDEDKIKINDLYLKIGTYSGVAKEMGCAATTVKKYIIPNYVPQNKKEYKKVFHIEELPEFSTELFQNVDDWGALCKLSQKEREGIKELWEDLLI